jgi:4-diphosphocytidyl-2-C-methyl-D-erythritol kinase
MGSVMSGVEKNSAAWLEKWPAPAKLNLMLRIVGRREDGYHLLQTVFQFVDWCDWLTFHPLAGGQVLLKKVIPGVLEASDLTVRAAHLLKLASGCADGVCIEVEKNLPMGAGLGGGSSDAATTLVVLNKLWGINFSAEKLMQLGLQLGADVPAFVYGVSSWAEGVGEKLVKITLPEQWVVIIKPDCHVDTRAIFLTNDLTRDSKSITMAEFVAGQHQNDCLAVVSKLYQKIAQALTELSYYAEARLTGTGACVFAEFDSKKSAEKAYFALQKNWQVHLVKSLNYSPLLVKLKNF